MGERHGAVIFDSTGSSCALVLDVVFVLQCVGRTTAAENSGSFIADIAADDRVRHGHAPPCVDAATQAGGVVARNVTLGDGHATAASEGHAGTQVSGVIDYG